MDVKFISDFHLVNIRLAIYHGTGNDVLQTGVGHLNGTKLPIGGESNHTVLAAHRGLPSAKLFTDIDQMEIGDKFYIHVLDQVLAYQVDQILPMVDKDDHETLDDAMKIEDGKDQVTLFTCTPYGVNSHRLLVRGTRVAYNGRIKIFCLLPFIGIIFRRHVIYATLIIADQLTLPVSIPLIRNRGDRSIYPYIIYQREKAAKEGSRKKGI